MRPVRVPLRQGRSARDLRIAVRLCHVPAKEAVRLVHPVSAAAPAGCVVFVSRQHICDRTLQQERGSRAAEVAVDARDAGGPFGFLIVYESHSHQRDRKQIGSDAPEQCEFLGGPGRDLHNGHVGAAADDRTVGVGGRFLHLHRPALSLGRLHHPGRRSGSDRQQHDGVLVRRFHVPQFLSHAVSDRDGS